MLLRSRFQRRTTLLNPSEYVFLDLRRTIRSQTLKSAIATYRVPFGVNFRKFNVSSRFTVRIWGVDVAPGDKVMFILLCFCLARLLKSPRGSSRPRKESSKRPRGINMNGSRKRSKRPRRSSRPRKESSKRPRGSSKRPRGNGSRKATPRRRRTTVRRWTR